MKKRSNITHRFVDYIPEELDDGVLYIALDFGAVIHLCCDGCGERVSTPLHPAQWKLIFDGETVSLRPSVGSSELACNSHYVIERGRVRWSRPLTSTEATRDHSRDLGAIEDYFDRDSSRSAPHQTKGEPASTKRSLWRRLRDRRRTRA